MLTWFITGSSRGFGREVALEALRLPLGNYAYDGLLEKLDMIRADVTAREAVSRGADRT